MPEPPALFIGGPLDGQLRADPQAITRAATQETARYVPEGEEPARVTASLVTYYPRPWIGSRRYPPVRIYVADGVTEADAHDAVIGHLMRLAGILPPDVREVCRRCSHELDPSGRCPLHDSPRDLMAALKRSLQASEPLEGDRADFDRDAACPDCGRRGCDCSGASW